MSRVVPFRAKAPPAVRQRVDETLATTMYLVQTTGPTSFVVQEPNCDKKHKVLIGPLQSCSCGDAEVCIHVLFVMLKVLRVPATNPVVWQKSLIDSEVDALLRGDYRESTRPPPPKNVTGFLKKHHKDAASAEPQTDSEESDAQRHELVPGEVCAICQEDMMADQPLTFCRKGCGNNFHIECMKVFGESRKQSKEHLICPLCRHDWGDLALTELKKEMEVANKAPNVHKHVACKKCQAKPIRNERYRCVQCKNVDLCDRCFKMNAHINHSFVMKKLVSDVWTPALRSSQARSSAIASELVEELQNRDLTTNDYDLLLQLDQNGKIPVQDYLLSILGGHKVSAANAKSFGDAGAVCSLCRQSLRIQADVRSIICGHAFHESCLARSILSQSYTCPYPTCEHVLFPGMHSLVVKKTMAEEDAGKLGQQGASASAVDMSLCVMPLQQQRPTNQPNNQPEKQIKPVKPHSRATNLTNPLTNDISALSIGPLSAVANVTTSQLPALPQIREKPRVQSTLRPPTNAPRSRESRSQQSTGLGMMQCDDQTLTAERTITIDDRLKHADAIRSELKKLDKDRLRKQRLQREERTRHHLSNNDGNHGAANVLLPYVGRPASSSSSLETIRQPNRPPVSSLVNRSQGSRARPRVGPDSMNQEEQKTGGILPELSIGGLRRS